MPHGGSPTAWEWQDVVNGSSCQWAPSVTSTWWARMQAQLMQSSRLPFAAPAAGTSTVVVGALTAAQIASALADRPLLMSTHAVAKASSDPLFRAWWSTAASFASGSNQVDPNQPASNVYDFQFNVATRPVVVGTTWNLMFDFGNSPQAFDCAAVLGHNFGTIGGLTVTLQCADDQAFSTNLRTLATWSPGTSNKRLISQAGGTLSLQDSLNGNANNRTLSAVRYLLLQITGTAPFQPQVGELVLASRRQLNQSALLAYDPDAEKARVVDFRSRSGVITRYAFNSGQQMLEGKLLGSVAAGDISPITSWWTDISQGVNPFLWVEHPNSAPATAYWMFADPPEFHAPFETNDARRWEFHFVEQGAPFFTKEV